MTAARNGAVIFQLVEFSSAYFGAKTFQFNEIVRQLMICGHPSCFLILNFSMFCCGGLSSQLLDLRGQPRDILPFSCKCSPLFRNDLCNKCPFGPCCRCPFGDRLGQVISRISRLTTDKYRGDPTVLEIRNVADGEFEVRLPDGHLMRRQAQFKLLAFRISKYSSAEMTPTFNRAEESFQLSFPGGWRNVMNMKLISDIGLYDSRINVRRYSNDDNAILCYDTCRFCYDSVNVRHMLKHVRTRNYIKQSIVNRPGFELTPESWTVKR